MMDEEDRAVITDLTEAIRSMTNAVETQNCLLRGVKLAVIAAEDEDEEDESDE